MASQGSAPTLIYYAYNTSTGAYTTGDVANHTLKLVKDGTEASPTNAAAEVDSTNMPGAYKVLLTTAETAFNSVTLGGKSSTANVIIIPITMSFEQLPTAAPGASNGVLISGSNSGTTTLGALTITGATTCTGNVSMAAGLTITQSSSNASALSVTGNGTGSGAIFTSGAGATGDGVKFTAASTNGNGLTLTHSGTGKDFNAQTTNALQVNTTAINAISASSVTAINANIGTTQILTFDGNNFLKVDLVDIAGSAVSTTSAQIGVNVVNINAQTATAAAGVTFPSSIASPTNITAGTITTATNLTNAPTAGDFTSTMKTSLNAATPASIVGAVGSVTGNVGGNVTGSVASVISAVSITSNRKKGSTATFEFLMQDSTTGGPITGLTVSSTISQDGGASVSTTNAVTEIGLGQYQIVLTGTEMTANNIFLQFTSTGALTANLSVQTQP